MGKREQTQTLNFFLVLTCLSTGSNTPIGISPKLGSYKLSSLYIFKACFLLTSFPNRISLLTLSRTQVVPHFHQSSWEQNHQLSLTHAHEISDLQFSLVNLNYKCLGLFIWWLLSALFNYLFSFLWAIQLHYNLMPNPFLYMFYFKQFSWA